jgi:HD-GYP domain-containing protein (c-di-GMP phosphodiesterase class II)
MPMLKHPYKLNFKKTREIFSLISDEDRVKKYLRELKGHSCEMYEHSIRTSLLCMDLGLENNLSLDDVRLLGYAGLLHDYGKVHISNEVLEKQTALTEKEKEKIKTHPRKAAENIHELGNRVKMLIAGHHEEQKKAYPRKGKDRRKVKRKVKGQRDRRKLLEKYKDLIQIVAVSDMYDALRMKRAYKPSKTRKETKEILYEKFAGDEKYIKQIAKR